MSSIPLSKKACEIIQSIIEDGREPDACHTWEVEQPEACHNGGERPLGNIFIRRMRFESKGDYMRGHEHNFDHVTIVLTGSVRVIATRPNGEELDGIFSAPERGRFATPTEGFLLIQKDTHHEIVALEDFTEAWCVFSHRDEHGEVVQDYNGNKIAYGSC